MRALQSPAQVRSERFRQRIGNTQTFRAAAAVGLVAVIVEFLISGNTLENLGIDYASAGGNPIVKLHPATYLAGLAAIMSLVFTRPPGMGVSRLLRQSPALVLYVGLIMFCAFYSMANVGLSGSATYVESYLAAGMLAIALEPASDKWKQKLGWWFIGLVLLSCAISVGENIAQTSLIPLHIGDADPKDLVITEDEFRGAGLFAHPLTAAYAGSLAIFLLLRMRTPLLIKALLLSGLMVGLLSFGGRAALLVTVFLAGAAGLVAFGRAVFNGTLTAASLGAVALSALILLIVLAVALTSTDIGERIFTHLYIDDSAEVRGTQWLILNHLTMRDVLFGVTPDRMEILKYQIGLGSATTDIENFWLLMFLNLGIIGFAVLLVALGLFFVHLGRIVDHPLGWIMLLASIVIDSTSNSLGRKSPDLVFMTACAIAMSGYRLPVLTAVRRPKPTRRPLEPIRSIAAHHSLA